MLEIVAEALKANQLRFTQCFNRSKDFESTTTGVEHFRNDPDVRILLMPLSLGAEGLDLIVASHVFLLEPLLNHPQELQAINRIDRIGQAKMTYVHKYVINGTIEEKIASFQQAPPGEEMEVTESKAAESESSAKASCSTPSKAYGQPRPGRSPGVSKGIHKVKGDDHVLQLADIRYILDLSD